MVIAPKCGRIHGWVPEVKVGDRVTRERLVEGVAKGKVYPFAPRLLFSNLCSRHCVVSQLLSQSRLAVLYLVFVGVVGGFVG